MPFARPSAQLLLFFALFLLMGATGSMNDILNPFLKASFQLGYRDAAWVHFSYYITFFLLSYPLGLAASRWGTRRTMLAGLLLMLAGLQLFHLAAWLASYPLFLAAIFTLASGSVSISLLSNTGVTQLGPLQEAPARLNLANGFHAAGTVLGPFLGSALVLGRMRSGVFDLSLIHLPYYVLSALLLLVFFWVWRDFAPAEAPRQARQAAPLRLGQHPVLLMGIGALFAYVGAEIAVASLIVKYIDLREVAGIPEQQAGYWVPVYWGGSMLGRFVIPGLFCGSSAQGLLRVHAAAACLLVIIVIAGRGWPAFAAILGLGLCNSIMFSNIFTLSVGGLGEQAYRGAGLLLMAVLGGALIPVLQGALADGAGLQISFCLPLACYAYIYFFAWKTRRIVPA
jgi:FHS family L-fucose permease-like MFS transporter